MNPACQTSCSCLIHAATHIPFNVNPHGESSAARITSCCCFLFTLSPFGSIRLSSCSSDGATGLSSELTTQQVSQVTVNCWDGSPVVSVVPTASAVSTYLPSVITMSSFRRLHAAGRLSVLSEHHHDRRFSLQNGCKTPAFILFSLLIGICRTAALACVFFFLWNNLSVALCPLHYDPSDLMPLRSSMGSSYAASGHMAHTQTHTQNTHSLHPAQWHVEALPKGLLGTRNRQL